MTSKQRAYLKGLASKENAIFQIGKNDITENMLIQLSNALEARELIKVTVLETSEYSPREAAEEVAEKTGAEVVIVIGRKFVLYRRSLKNHKILVENI